MTGSGLPPKGGSAALAPGVILDGKYEILSLLGVGGMGEVYKANHIHLHTVRCVKVMRSSLLGDDTYRARFLREARLATQIHHPNIAVVHDFAALSDGVDYMVTEFIDGTTIRQWSAQHGRFPLALAAEVASQVLVGLGHIHRRGMLHRDISADNIMLMFDADDRLTVKIIDLGIAKDVTVASDTTQAGMLIGNPKYMSPEQLGELPEGEQIDARADIYSFGVVLYEMLLGVPPFQSKTPHGYIVKHLTQQPPAFEEAAPGTDYPAALEVAIFRALEKDRNKRYPDARQFADALRPFLLEGRPDLTKSMVGRLQSQPGNEAPVVQRVDPPAETPTEVVNEEAEFQKAWEDGRTVAWRSFLEKTASPDLRKRAQGLLEEAVAFQVATNNESQTGLREFLKMFPDGRHHMEAEIILARLKAEQADRDFDTALAADTYVAMRDFLAKHPSFDRADDARRAMEERMAFETAAALDSEESWEEYLELWPTDPHAADAQARLAVAREREEKAFNAAVEGRSVAGWESFLEHFPHSTRAARAEHHRDELIEAEKPKETPLDEYLRLYPTAPPAESPAEKKDFETAWEVGSVSAWDAFLDLYPNSARAAEARECRLEAQEFEMAVSLNTQKMWRAFLKAWPEGRHRLDAEVRLRNAK